MRSAGNISKHLQPVDATDAAWRRATSACQHKGTPGAVLPSSSSPYLLEWMRARAERACVMLSPSSHSVRPLRKGHRSQGVMRSMLPAHASPAAARPLKCAISVACSAAGQIGAPVCDSSESYAHQRPCVTVTYITSPFTSPLTQIMCAEHVMTATRRWLQRELKVSLQRSLHRCRAHRHACIQLLWIICLSATLHHCRMSC